MIPFAAAVALTVACAPAQSGSASAGTDATTASAAADLTQSQTADLARALKGKTPGAPVNCVSASELGNPVPVGDSILLYSGSGGVTYRNNLRAACPGLGRNDDLLVAEVYGAQQCSGDRVRQVDRFSGIPGPVCGLGAFIPYRPSR